MKVLFTSKALDSIMNEIIYEEEEVQFYSNAGKGFEVILAANY